MVAAVVLAACGSSTPATLTPAQAQRFAHSRNLRVSDLPLGWTATATPLASVAAVSAPTVRTLLPGLPAYCHVLDPALSAAMGFGSPASALGYDQVAVAAPSDPGAAVGSTVAVFSSIDDGENLYNLYASATFEPCLRSLVTAALTRTGVTDVHVQVVTSGIAGTPPVGVASFQYTVSSAGTRGSGTVANVFKEAVAEEYRGVSMVKVVSPSATLPSDLSSTFNNAVQTVVQRLIPPPA
jgi:hypothetical protein